MRQLRADVWLLELGYREPLDANAYLIDDRIDPESGERRRTRGDGGTDEDGWADGDDGADDGDGNGEVTLIDSGIRYPSSALHRELAAAGYEPEDIDRVLLTHYDLDHTGGLDRIGFKGPVYLGERDVWLVRGEWDPPWYHHKGLWHLGARRLFPVSTDDLRPVRDGDRIGRFTAHYTPGHNPGHTAYVHDSGVAFVGDLVWGTDGVLTTPFWGDSYNMRRLRESVAQFSDRAGEFDLLCMGHGVPILGDAAEQLRGLVGRLD